MSDPLLAFKLVLIFGLTLWMTVVVINNTTAFRGGVASIGMLMGMQLFDQQPAIKTPLLSRRVTSVQWHRLVYAFVLLVEIAVALLFWQASISFGRALWGGFEASAAVASATLALAALAAMVFVLALGGSWFVYYLRQEGTQITHFALLAVAIGATLVVNL